MALAHELPIYKQTYDLLSLSIDITKNFPRDFKRSYGEKIRTECVDMTVLIFRANVSRQKTPHIQELRERLQVTELLLRMSRDKRWISVPQYASAVELTQSIGKQATGWERYAKASPAP
jgi:hypothetical protein